MAVKRIVDTSFWEDVKVIDMYSTEDRYFMLYFMTNPQSTQLGIYPLPIRIASFQTGHSPESTKEIINRFTSRHKTILYDWFTQEISLIDSLKYSVIKGGKPVEDLLVKEIGRVQSDNLVVLTYEHMLSFWNKSDRIFDKTIKQIFEHELEKRKNIISNANDNDNDNDNEESYHESYHESSEKTAVVDVVNDFFERIWILYPNKKGKSTISKTTKNKLFKVGEDKLKLAIEHYQKELSLETWKHPMNGSTFFNGRYTDYLQENIPEPKKVDLSLKKNDMSKWE